MTTLETKIADALGTDERGDDLVEVARNAHRAEVKLASVLELLRRIDDNGDGSDLLDDAMNLIEGN